MISTWLTYSSWSSACKIRSRLSIKVLWFCSALCGIPWPRGYSCRCLSSMQLPGGLWELSSILHLQAVAGISGPSQFLPAFSTLKLPNSSDPLSTFFAEAKRGTGRSPGQLPCSQPMQQQRSPLPGATLALLWTPRLRMMVLLYNSEPLATTPGN
jgi:hypothetical protein